VAVIDYLGMQPCDGTAALGKAGATTHNLHLYVGREGGGREGRREGGREGGEGRVKRLVVLYILVLNLAFLFLINHTLTLNPLEFISLFLINPIFTLNPLLSI